MGKYREYDAKAKAFDQCFLQQTGGNQAGYEHTRVEIILLLQVWHNTRHSV